MVKIVKNSSFSDRYQDENCNENTFVVASHHQNAVVRAFAYVLYTFKE